MMKFITLLVRFLPELAAALQATLEKAKVDPALAPDVDRLEAMLNEELDGAAIAAFLNASGPELWNIVQFKFEPRKHPSGII